MAAIYAKIVQLTSRRLITVPPRRGSHDINLLSDNGSGNNEDDKEMEGDGSDESMLKREWVEEKVDDQEEGVEGQMGEEREKMELKDVLHELDG